MGFETIRIQTNRGGNEDGGAFFVSGLVPNDNQSVYSGINLDIEITATSGTSTDRMSAVTDWAEREYDGTTTLWLAATRLFAYDTRDAIRGDGIADSVEVDIDNEVVWTKDAIIADASTDVGRTVTTTLNGSITDSATTFDVTDSTGFPASGNALLVDRFDMESISYTSVSGNTLNGVTRGLNNTTAASHSDDTEIAALDTDWKTVSNGEAHPMTSIEDWVFIGNGRYVAGYKEPDGSDWNTNQLDLPKSYDVVDFSSILTGGGLKLMIGANRGNKGDMFVWDMADDTWDRVIHLERPIEKMYEQYIATDIGLYETDGYKIVKRTMLPGEREGITVYDMVKKGNNLYVLLAPGSSEITMRNRYGLWLLTTYKWDWYYLPFQNRKADYIGDGSIYLGSQFANFVSRAEGVITSGTSNGVVEEIELTDIPVRTIYYQAEVNPKDATTRTLEEVRVNVNNDNKWKDTGDDFDFDVVVRYYNYKTSFENYIEMSADASSKSVIPVEKGAGYSVPEVGDRIEITGNQDSSAISEATSPAGAARNIIAVSDEGTHYNITLDEDLPAIPKNNSGMMLQPLKKVAKRNISGDSFDWQDLNFVVDDKPEFKKLLIEVELRNNTLRSAVVLNNIELKTKTVEPY